MKSFNERRRPRRNVNQLSKSVTNEELLNKWEDYQLAQMYEKHVIEAEQGNVEKIKFESVDELFNKLK